MTGESPFSHPLRVADLARRKPTRFSLEPDSTSRARIAAQVGALSVESARLAGEIRPLGRHDFELEAELEATAAQACVVTLVPVVAKIREKVLRRYLSEVPEPAGDEVEMPEDDSIEQLGPVIDLGEVLTEALTLALPDYPRAPGAEIGEAEFTAPGVAPMGNVTQRPFAGLASLRDKLAGDDGDEK